MNCRQPQRGCGLQPRVARNELLWETSEAETTTPTGLRPWGNPVINPKRISRQRPQLLLKSNLSVMFLLRFAAIDHARLASENSAIPLGLGRLQIR